MQIIYYMTYYIHLAVKCFGRLVSFQSVTTIPLADAAFSIATIASLCLIAVMLVKPKIWNITAILTIDLSAIAAVCYLLATREDSAQYGLGNLAVAGYFTALLQLLSLFILILLVAWLSYLIRRKISANISQLES